jgi:NAD+ kinase
VLAALGGDGTTLAALHAAAPHGKPVLGVACGSIGVLTAVTGDRLAEALEQVAHEHWTPRELPALEVAPAGGEPRFAINDFAAVRAGAGQLIASVGVDGELYARAAGDGVIVATQPGSSAYTMAAGGPILGPGVDAMVVTQLAHHGGVTPPLVANAASTVTIAVEPGFGGRRFELDGQPLDLDATEFAVTLRRDYSTLIALAGQEGFVAGLRRRGLVVDSPRILARDARERG